MSTPSMLLQCAAAAASLAGVWTLAGLSESSTLKPAPRALLAGAVGVLGTAALYARAPSEARSDLSLPLLFGLASALALTVGAAKLEAALVEKNGPRVVRRAAGIVAGTYFGMAAVGAASLDLGSSSLALSRVGWSLMVPLVAAVFAVFAQRGRYAGVGLLALGNRAFVLLLVAAALLVGARLTAGARPVRAALDVPAAPTTAPSVPAPVATTVEASTASAPSATVEAASASAAPSASAPAPSVQPGELQIEAVTSRGMLEADARGGVQRRMDRLKACLSDPKNQQGGTLSLKIGIDPSGSVSYSRATGGDLMGTPLAACLLPVFYKMGFATTKATNASFDITLRAPSP